VETALTLAGQVRWWGRTTVQRFPHRHDDKRDTRTWTRRFTGPRRDTQWQFQTVMAGPERSENVGVLACRYTERANVHLLEPE